MRVSQMMSVNLVTCPGTTTVGEACRLMSGANVGSVLVCDGGQLRGIFTERDVLRLVAEGRAVERELVSDQMTSSVVSVAPDARAEEVAELMNRRHIRHLPVVDGGTPVGLVSLRDFFVMSGAILRAQGADAASEMLRAATVH
jgi:CBS domain-containing protein